MPICAAIVKATSGEKTVSRFTQADGRYSLTVPNGTYQVAVTVFGYGPKTQTKNTAEATDTNFKLSPNLEILTSCAKIDFWRVSLLKSPFLLKQLKLQSRGV